MELPLDTSPIHWQFIGASSASAEGERYTVDVAFLGRRHEQSFEVTTYEPPRRYVDRKLGGPFRDEHTYTFEEEAGGMRLSPAMDMQPGDVFGIGGPLL
jgi:hypothetical protein